MGPLILTNIGLAKLASATPENQIEIKSVAVGDSDAPIDPTNTALNNEVWRGDSSLPIRDPMDAKVLIFEGVIPASVGGFTIREVGLFDVDGDLIAIGHTSEIDKPAPSAGTPITLTARVRLMLDNASQTDLIIADTPLIDHQGTSNRDAVDAHPIEAITGLSAELDLKANSADLGTAAYRDAITLDVGFNPSNLLTPTWRGLDKRSFWSAGKNASIATRVCKIATVRTPLGASGLFRVQLAQYDLNPTPAGFIDLQISATNLTPFVSMGGFASGERFGRDDATEPPYVGVVLNTFESDMDLGSTWDVYVEVAAGDEVICDYVGTAPLEAKYTGEFEDPIPPGSIPCFTASTLNTVSIPAKTEASVLEAQELTTRFSLMTPRRVADSLNAQTWQDMTSVRAPGTTYTNTTIRPITVSYTGFGFSGRVTIDALVDGAFISGVNLESAAGAVSASTTLVVPSGSTYRIDDTSSDPSHYHWAELRT